MRWMGSWVASGFVLFGALLVLFIVTGELVGAVAAVVGLFVNGVFAMSRWRRADDRR
jgi:hypothetical protein